MACGFPTLGRLLPDTPPERKIEQLQSDCSETSLKVTSLRGYRNPEIENITPSHAKINFFMKMSILPAAGARSSVIAPSPRGILKITDIFRFFLEPSRNHSGAPLGRQSEPKGRPRCQNGAPKLTFGPSGMTFSVKIRDSGTLLEHWYLLCFYNKNNVWGRTECVQN